MLDTPTIFQKGFIVLVLTACCHNDIIKMKTNFNK